MLTIDILAACMPQATATNIARFANPLAAACREFGIDNPGRLAAFIAQVAHESGSLRSTVENLNYSADGLRKAFPRHFSDPATALDYARHPQRIANLVYASRMGNGDEASGDGERYRGRGLIQLTGRDGYARCGAALGLDLIGRPEMLEQPVPAARSAAWFWATTKRDGRSLNELADSSRFEDITRAINGGTNGLADRQLHYATALKALCVPGATQEG